VYRVRPLWADLASLDLPRVVPMTCGGDKAAGQRVAQSLLCKQGVGGSSPLVSTLKPAGQTSSVLPRSVQNAHGSIRMESKMAFISARSFRGEPSDHPASTINRLPSTSRIQNRSV
jgi:hypothetical protein